MEDMSFLLLYAAVPVAVCISWMKYRGLEYILMHYRWIFVVGFLMPLSVLFDLYFFVRNWLVFKLHSAPEKHDERVKSVQKQASIEVLT